MWDRTTCRTEAVVNSAESFVQCIVCFRHEGLFSHHGWVAEAAHIYPLLEVLLCHGLGPQPAPVLLLVLLPEFLEVLDVASPALGVTVEDVGQEGDHAQGVRLARSAHNLQTFVVTIG